MKTVPPIQIKLRYLKKLRNLEALKVFVLFINAIQILVLNLGFQKLFLGLTKDVKPRIVNTAIVSVV